MGDIMACEGDIARNMHIVSEGEQPGLCPKIINLKIAVLALRLEIVYFLQIHSSFISVSRQKYIQ